MLALVGTCWANVLRQAQSLRSNGFKEGEPTPFGRPFVLRTSDSSSRTVYISTPVRNASHVAAGRRPAGSPYYDFLPEYVGSISADPSKVVSWDRPRQCFHGTKASAKLLSKGFILQFDLSKPQSLLCRDLYLIVTVNRFLVHDFLFAGQHTVEVKDGWKPHERQDVEQNGFRVFLIDKSIIRLLVDVYETLSLFLGDRREEENIRFLKDRAGLSFSARQEGKVSVDPAVIPSGTLIGATSFTGWNPLTMWGMGSYVGHQAMALWMDRQLYIVESFQVGTCVGLGMECICAKSNDAADGLCSPE